MTSNTNTTKTTAQRGRPSTKRAERPTRVPMSGQRLRMHISEEEQDPAFHYAWINDDGDLIFRAKRAGYTHVEREEMPTWGEISVDSANSVDSVISMPVGQGKTAYLMKQPMEFYEEDKAAADRLVDAREADMKKELNSGKDGTYGSVEIT